MMKRIPYEPGNGTRYDLVFGRVPGITPDREPLFMVTWLRNGGGGVSMTLRQDVPVHTYISEKLDCGEVDAKAIALFLEAAIEAEK